ncbi:MAG: polysaccharide biosynthesis C-terminal domain-containing protein, partial [Candidatus Gastranaerophilales bacterium]|nr:polysaccharide biosynthesis C-terminal domain-containing protein [Candidatus Gastranaerophilales bacterium]
MLIYATIIFGILLATFGILNIHQIVLKLGATAEMVDFCVKYATIVLCALPFCMLQNVFQSFFVTAEKPKIGLFVIVLAGVMNIILDYIFIVPLNMGLVGAAIATAVSQFIGGFIPVLYFARKNSSLLKLGKTEFNLPDLFKTMVNGSSEFMSNISSSIVTAIYNYQLLKYVGEDGVAAYGTMMYIMFIFFAVYMGFCIGSAPLFSFNYGANNTDELKNLTGKSLKIIAVLGLSMTLIAEIFANPLSRIFVGYDAELLSFTVHGLKIFALCFIVGGFNVFGSAFFTALNNGVVSAIISILRTLVFEVICVLMLPLILEVDGIWISVLVAETLALCVSAGVFVKMRKRYKY